MKRVICACVGGKPVFPIDLLAPGREYGMQILVAFALFVDAFFRNKLASALYDLEIAVVHPNAPLKVAVFPDHFFRGHIEHEAVQFVLLLLSNVEQVVLSNLIYTQSELIPILDFIHVAGPPTEISYKCVSGG